MTTVRELMEENGWTKDDVAERLAEAGVTVTQGKTAGTPIDSARVKRYLSSPVPKAWQEALGVDDQLALDDEKPLGRANETAPRAPRNAKLEEPLQLALQSPTRIAGAYRFAGGMLANGSGSQGVAKVWDDSADAIATLWVKAAETNPWAARFVAFMNSGGTMGDLAGSHLYLAGATLYVLGANVPAGDGLFAKYKGYRPVVVVNDGDSTDDAAAAAAAGVNGSEPAHQAAAPPVG